jgi:hypothetical protein
MDDNGSDEEFIGYKAFYPGLVNNYGVCFKVGGKYKIGAGYENFGFHFCGNLEDIYIYYRDIPDMEVCLVKGKGLIANYSNDYYGVYDVYATREIEILRKVEREEIINNMLNCYSYRVERFISLCRLSDEEILLFEGKFFDNWKILKYIDYYQKGDDKAFVRTLVK